MSDVYLKATYVVSWLGLDPNTKGFLDQVHRSVSFDELSSGINKDQLENTAIEFGSLTYWIRLWIHQEVLLGWTSLMFMAGDAVVSRVGLSYWRPNFSALVLSSWPTVSNDLLDPEIAWLQTYGYLPLCYVLCRFSSNTCVDARDRIYGLLGLVYKDERIKVDYTRSNPEVFFDTVDKLLEVGDFNVHDPYPNPTSREFVSRGDSLRQVEEMVR